MAPLSLIVPLFTVRWRHCHSSIVDCFSAYLPGTTDQGLIYFDNRMKHRLTYVEWEKVLMGPIHDKLGVEQGRCNSDRIYRVADKELSLTQASMLGLNMGAIHCASIGQADDVWKYAKYSFKNDSSYKSPLLSPFHWYRQGSSWESCSKYQGWKAVWQSSSSEWPLLIGPQ